MNVIVKRLDETDFSYEQIVNLMHESFEERLQQGLNFTCSFMSVEQYKEKNADGIIFVALNEDLNELMGSITVHIRTDSENNIYGYNEFLAVCSKAKRLGIGTKLARACECAVQEAGGTYVMCDTAVDATSSVRYHLKQGFKIIGLRSYSSTNYYSYLFRKQLVPSKKWDSVLYCKCAFFLSYIITKLKLRKDGSSKYFYSIYKRMKG